MADTERSEDRGIHAVPRPRMGLVAGESAAGGWPVRPLPRTRRSFECSRLLFWSAGADERLMGDSRIERFRYLGVGSSVLLTASAATFAMIVFLRLSIPGPWARDIAYGIFWGLFIFTIDRWLVSSIHYGPLDDTNDGSDRSGAKRLAGAAGRLFLAFFLAATISGPIILALFAPEISGQLARNQNRDKGAAAVEIRENSNYVTRRAEIGKARKVAEDNETSKIAAQTDAQKDVDDEISGAGGSRRKGCDLRPGIGVCWQKIVVLKKAQREAVTAQDAATTARTKAKNDTVALEADIDAAVTGSDTKIAGNGGALAREEALFDVLGAHPVLWFRWAMISGLFLLVDLMPVVLKMFGPATLHDRNARLAAVEQAITVNAELALGRAELNSDVKVRRETIAANEEIRLAELDVDRKLGIMRVQRRFERAQEHFARGAGRTGVRVDTTTPERSSWQPAPVVIQDTWPDPPADSEERPGRRPIVLNDRWQIDRPFTEADQGGFGEVYLAIDLLDDGGSDRGRRAGR